MMCYYLNVHFQGQRVKATIPSTDHDTSKTAAECGIFQPFLVT